MFHWSRGKRSIITSFAIVSALDTTVPPVSVEWKNSSSSTSLAVVWWRMKTISIRS